MYEKNGKQPSEMGDEGVFQFVAPGSDGFFQDSGSSLAGTMRQLEIHPLETCPRYPVRFYFTQVESAG
jgi:hypothetical protein